MAKELQPIERQVSTPQVNAGNNTAYAQMGEATSKISNLLAEQLSNQAAYQSGLAGQQMALEGRAPKNLAFPFTKATAAYNDAVVKIETNQLVTEGRNQLLEAYAMMADKSKFNEQTPAIFKARIEGIEQGILEAARPENRAAIKEGLSPLLSRVQFNMLNDSINYDNEKVLNSLKLDLDKAEKIRQEAYLTGNKSAIAEANRNIGDILENYRKISKQVEDKLPEITQKLNESAIIAQEVSSYMAAREAGESQKFLAGFAKNKPEGLTIEQHFTALQKMLAMQSTFDSAESANQSLAKQLIQNDMNNPYSPNYINSLESLQAHPGYGVLSPLQQQQIFGAFLQAQSEENKRSEKITGALAEISYGRAGAVDKGTINEIFDSRLKQFEQITGTQANLAQQFNMVQELQTNVKRFDSLIKAKLTSMDPLQVLEASQVYATAVLADKENLIDLSGDAETIAQKMVTLLEGTNNPSEESIKSVINQVTKLKTDAEVKSRYDKATATLTERGPTLYKELFDAKPDPFMDHGAYTVFKTAYLNAFDRAGSEEEALRIVKKEMRGWNKSPWFKDNVLGQGAPELENPLSNGTYNIRNQLVVAVDYLVRENNKQVTPKNGKYKMKLLGAPIPEKFSPDEFVFKPLGYKDTAGTTAQTAVGPIATREDSFFPTETPIYVEVDGHKSKISIDSNRQTRATDGTWSYGIFYQDREGVYQQFKDPKSHDGLAYVTIKDLDKIVPSVFENQENKRLKGLLEKTRMRQLGQTMQQELMGAIAQDPLRPLYSGFKYALKESLKPPREKKEYSLKELQDAINQNE